MLPKTDLAIHTTRPTEKRAYFSLCLSNGSPVFQSHTPINRCLTMYIPQPVPSDFAPLFDLGRFCASLFLPVMGNPALSLLMLSVSALFFQGAWSATFTFVNKCHYTVWPGLLSGASSGQLPTTGFRLKAGTSRSVDAPANWSGRMWARTQCGVDSTGRFSCATGDCGAQRQCNNAGGAPPVTLAEFTLQGADGKDFYDVSNVDGFNVPMSITPTGQSGCPSTTCRANINSICPRALQTKLPNGRVVGCKSACLAFDTDRYCCRGLYANPNTCKPTAYSSLFKKACPQAYSYAYDDGTSTFTCIGANYTITFCP